MYVVRNFQFIQVKQDGADLIVGRFELWPPVHVIDFVGPDHKYPAGRRREDSGRDEDTVRDGAEDGTGRTSHLASHKHALTDYYTRVKNDTF